MNKHSQDPKFSTDSLSEDAVAVQRVLNRHLDAQLDDLDYTITSKLSAARHKALAGESRTGSSKYVFSGQRWARPLVASCAVVLVAIVALQLNKAVPEIETTQVAINESTRFIQDLNILTAADDIDFYQSVEFFEWMENNSG